MVSEVRRAHDFIFSQIFIIYHIIFFFLFHSHFSEVLWLFYFIFIANWMSGSFQWDDKNVENVNIWWLLWEVCSRMMAKYE